MRWNLKKSYEKAAKKKTPNGTLMGFLSRAIERATKKSCGMCEGRIGGKQK